jgi:cysteine desulfurase
MMDKIYFDNGATTKVDERVVDIMIPFFDVFYGNTSSLHAPGEEAKRFLEEARTRMANLLKVKSEEVIFTGSGSESNNLAIKGVAYANRDRGKHIIVSQVEHDCILESCQWLEREGFDVTYLPVDAEGFVELEELKKAIRKDTILVSIMHANNEIGTIQPIEDIARICKNHGVLFHTDACQSFGKISISMINIDLMTINSHKIYGPKGVGALIIKEGVSINPILHGGGHEFGIRSSTVNLPGIVGFVKAAELCYAEMEEEKIRLTRLRNKIIDTVLKDFSGVAYLNGPRKNRLCNNVNLGFHGMEGESTILLLKLNDYGIAVSTGSACSSNRASSSHVLKAIGLNPVEAIGALRITLGRYNTEKEVDYFLKVLPEAIKSIKNYG